MIRILKQSVIILLISGLIASGESPTHNANFKNLDECQSDYTRQVRVNLSINNYLMEYKNTAQRNIDRCNGEKKLLKQEIKNLKQKKKTDFILRVPFTEIGITKDHCAGFIVGYVLCLI